jgi:PAS domain S-box-containing protein
MDPGAEMQPQDFGIGRLFWRIHEAVIVGDADTGQIVLWNPAAEALFGYADTEVVGQPIEILIPEQLRARHHVGLARFGVTGQSDLMDADLGLELPAVHKSGHLLTIELLLSPIDDVPGGGRFVLAVIRDATARKRAEDQRVDLAREQAARAGAEAAEHERAYLAAIVASSNDAIIGKTLDGEIVSWNAAAEHLYGYTAEEMVGCSIARLIPPDLPDELLSILERLRRGEHIEQHDTVRVGNDGRRLDVSVSVSPIRNEQGEILGAATIAHDITERKRIEAVVLQAVQMEQRLEGVKLAVREVAHLLNNDLALAVGTLDLLQGDRRLSAEALESVHTTLAALDTAIQHLAKFQRVVRVETQESPIGLTLDVERSI